MPKQIHKIEQFHGGLNSSSDPRDIIETEVSAATDIMVDQLGKIRMMGDGLYTTGMPYQASTAIEDGYGLFHTAFDWSMFSRVTVSVISGSIAAGDTITGQASGATAYVVKNYANVLYLINNRKGSRIVHGAHSGSTTARNFIYRVIQGDVVNLSATVELDATGFDVLTANGSPALYITGTNIAAGAYVSAVTDNDTFTMNTVATGSSNNIPITFKEVVTGSVSGARAYVVSEITYPANTGTSCYFIQDQDKVHLYDKNLSTAPIYWLENVIDLGTDTSNVQPVFYIVDGMLRVCDGNHANTGNSTQFFGYIPAREMTGSGSYSETASGWFTGDAEITGLSAWQFSDGPKNDIINASTDYGGTDGDFEMYLDEDGDAGGTWDGSWKGGLTFIYDDGQESDLLEGPDTLVLSATKQTSIGITLYLATPHANGLIPERVKKVGVYLQDTSSTEWWYQGELDLKLGGLKSGDDYRQPWLQTGSGTATFAQKYTYLRDNNSDEFTLGPSLVTTFESRTGRKVGDTTVATFKSAVVANRMVYAANIQQDSEVFGDRIIKSPVNKFDIFSSKRSIEATINDGDEIVAIQSYADRILEFKKSKMTVINVSQEVEFLEETFPFKGILSPTAVCRTDYGVAWVNENGCFLFDGKQVTDLLDKGGLQKIKESDWQSFITDTSMIGFYPKKKQLIVVKDTSTASAGDIYLFDMVTGSWVQGDSKLTDSLDYTNFINNVLTGDLIYAANTGTSTFYSWRDTAQSSSAVSFQTKDIDFGQPAQRKKVYKIYVSYKGDGSSVTIKYSVNGETDASDLYAFDSANLADKSSAENLESWHLAELKPGTSSQSNNIYSFQIVFDGTAGATFEINDISIVYRMKGIK